MKSDPTFSHFRIGEPLGRGGTGTVYRAEDLSLHRPVALKFLLEEPGADGRQRTCFLREARTAAALNHPNICTIHEVGEVEQETTLSDRIDSTRIPAGSPFLSMELIEGETLRETLDRSPLLPLSKLLDIAAQIADGLAEAHSRKIVHRDLKPGNVMVTPAGRVKILHFGLAKSVEPLRSEGVLGATGAASAELTLSGQVHGTFAHMSPEQAEGRRVDHRSDIFAFGTLLYEMATGRNPFAADSPAGTMAKVLESAPKPLPAVRPDLPAHLKEIVERCLQKSPEDRYADTGELARELRELQDAVRAGKLRRGPGWLPSKQVLSFAAIGVLAASAATIVYQTGKDEDGTPKTVAVSPSRVAVFPFTVKGAERFSYLSEGMVDLLGALLDGAGELRSVDPFVVASRMRNAGIQVPDPESGESLAKQLGADLYVLGNLVEANGHLQVTCSLYEVDGASPASALASVDEESRLYELVEDLARQLLVDRGVGVEISMDATTRPTGSIDALKEYLDGERLRRAGRWSESVDAYQRAVDADSAFALAWYGLCSAANITFETDRARDASRKAMTLRETLPQRERYLVEAQEAFSRGAFGEAERLFQAILAIDPHDAAAWFGLAENHIHSAHLRGRAISEAYPMMQRALDEGMPQDHAIMIIMYVWAALVGGRLEEAAEWDRRFLELFPESVFALLCRADLAFLDNDERGWADVLSEIRRIDDLGGWFAATGPELYLRQRPLQAVRWMQQATRVFVESRARPSEVRAAGRIALAHLELAIGRREAADAEFERARALDPAATLEYEALLAVGPIFAATPGQLEQFRQTLLAWDSENVARAVEPNPFICPHDSWHPELRRYLLGLISVRRGEPATAVQYAEELELSVTTQEETAVGAMLAQSIRTHLALAQGDSAAALDELERMTFGPSWELGGPVFSRSLDRYLLAELLDAKGRSEEALLWFEGVANANAYLGPSLRRRGEICERLGRIEEAREHYRRFLDLRQNCDPECQPQVDEVTQRVEALTGT